MYDKISKFELYIESENLTVKKLLKILRMSFRELKQQWILAFVSLFLSVIEYV